MAGVEPWDDWSMYAVIRTGGKQYRVEKGAVLRLEKLAGEAGESVTFDDVLMLDDGESAQIGAPCLDGARVTAEVLEQTRGPKIVVFKKKRRKNYRRTQGHRQDLTVVRITDIQAKGAAKAKPKARRTTKKTGEDEAPKADSKAKKAENETPAAESGAQE